MPLQKHFCEAGVVAGDCGVQWRIANVVLFVDDLVVLGQDFLRNPCFSGSLAA